MPRDYISRKQTPEWRANYDKVFPAKPRPKKRDERPIKDAETQRRELALAFPFCPHLRDG